MIASKLAPLKIGIASETDRLRLAALAGLPSIEQELTHLYPSSRSLFLDHMDVATARKELAKFASLLAENGVSVIVMKEELAKILPETGLSKDEILKALFKKADSIVDGTGVNGNASLHVKEKIENLLNLDIELYGEKGALALAKALCLDTTLPLGNIIYSRDQTNVVFGHRIVAKMAYDIRVPEVELYNTFYKSVLGPNNTIEIPYGEKFEGGDLYVHNNTVFIGVGPRTSLKAALHIISKLAASDDVKAKGAKFAIVMNGKNDQTFAEQQESMHLDTFSMPIGDKEIAVCEHEAQKRHVYLVDVDTVGKQKFTATKKTFIDYLYSQGYEISVVSKEEQNSFGCNILMLDDGTAFMPISPSASITRALRDGGKKVITVPMEATTNGFGATHCAVGQLHRA